jgi:geranylgeranyl reductase family protein
MILFNNIFKANLWSISIMESSATTRADKSAVLDIAIIGAGPIGCYAGYNLAKAGHKVTIYENHAQIGSPIQCTGLLTSDFDEFNLPMDSFLVNTLDHIEVISPSGEKLRIAQKEYLVCRTKFDNFFADLAKKAGAKIKVNHSFQEKNGCILIIKDTIQNKEIEITPDIVIAADGPLSVTAKAYGMYFEERENFYGIQATVKGKFTPGTYQAYFGNDICPGLFAWVVPESSTQARVGVATKRETKRYFDQFLKKNNYTMIDMQAGAIPLYHPKQKIQQDNCYVLGDASSFVKATTLGGLIPGLKQAEKVARCIIEGKKNKVEIEREIKQIRSRLSIHLRLHKMFQKFSDKDWDRLIHYINQPRIQKILHKHTRENPFPIVIKSLLKEPRFLYFMKYLF